MDPNTGRIIAAASYPTYDPTVFVGGISAADYAKLTAPAANDPLVGRAIAGAYAPGVDVQADLGVVGRHPQRDHDDRQVPLPVPADGGRAGQDELRQRGLQLPADPQAGPRRLVRHVLLRAGRERVLRRSGAASMPASSRTSTCRRWRRRSASAPVPGVDLPTDEQTTGSYADRETRLADWDAEQGAVLRRCGGGLPERNRSDPAGLPDRARARRTAPTAGATAPATTPTWRSGRARRRCRRCNWRWPIRRCSTAARSGIRRSAGPWSTRNGKVVKTINPTVKSKVPVAQSTLSFIANVAAVHHRPFGVGCARLRRGARTRPSSVARPVPPRCSASKTRPGSRRGAR